MRFHEIIFQTDAESFISKRQPLLEELKLCMQHQKLNNQDCTTDMHFENSMK